MNLILLKYEQIILAKTMIGVFSQSQQEENTSSKKNSPLLVKNV